MSDLEKVIKQSFEQYSAAVIQSRALVDSRDFLKPSARQIFYSMLLNRITSKNPYKKTANAVGLAMADFYIHGDSSCEGIIMRASQDFSMRYPLVSVKGNSGSLIESGNWAAPRYSESRLSEMSNFLFEDINKDTIEEWRDSYDNTKQYPSVLPSKGFYNIVNGTSGIATGIASSIPQFNIKDVNKALEILLLNPNATFEEIYCPPDFATGAYLINEDEVKNTLKYGSKALAGQNEKDGAACRLRAKIDYSEKEKCLVVTEIPYGVYTNTICGQLERLIEDDNLNPGIDRFNDLTGETPNIKIYLKRGADKDLIIKSLYKNTSLQYHYSINMTMLDKGRFPKVFTWKEALQSHIDHELEVYIKGFNFDLNKLKFRINIIDGLLICMASIEEVIQTIKTSSSTAEASNKLQKQFLLNEEQSKAVLDMKLSRLAHLEVEKLKNEKSNLQIEFERIGNILKNRDLLNNELIKTWRDISNKYGDEHRTKVIEVIEDVNEKENELLNIKAEDVIVTLTKNGEIKRVPANTYKAQNRNTKGAKNNGEVILLTLSTNTLDNLLLCSDKGRMYKILVDDIPDSTKEVNIANIISMEVDEKIIAATPVNRKSTKEFIIFITKKGLVKKTKLEEYKCIKKGINAIKLNNEDFIVNVVFADNEELLLTSKNGFTIRIETSSINPIGKIAAGVKGITLADNDYIVSALLINDYKQNLAVFTSEGNGKRLELSEFPIQSRGGKGTRCSDAEIAKTCLVDDDSQILVIGNKNTLCINVSTLPISNKKNSGVKVIKDNQINNITKI